MPVYSCILMFLICSRRRKCFVFLPGGAVTRHVFPVGRGELGGVTRSVQSPVAPHHGPFCVHLLRPGGGRGGPARQATPDPVRRDCVSELTPTPRIQKHFQTLFLGECKSVLSSLPCRLPADDASFLCNACLRIEKSRDLGGRQPGLSRTVMEPGAGCEGEP